LGKKKIYCGIFEGLLRKGHDEENSARRNLSKKEHLDNWGGKKKTTSYTQTA